MKLAITAALLLSTAVYAGEYSDNNVTMAPTVHPTKPCFDSLTWEGPGEVELECLPMKRPGDPGISPYAYVPNPADCKIVTYVTSTYFTIPPMEGTDKSCMQRQRINAGLKYCSTFPTECSPQIEMFGRIPMQVNVPNDDAGFWDLTKEKR